MSWAMHVTGPVIRALRQRRGIALVSVLWGLTLLSVVAASFTRTTRTEVNLARNAVDNAKAEAAADAGVYRAIAALLDDEPAARWIADGRVYNVAFADAKIAVSLRDERGKIDLNAAPDEHLRGLFEAAGADSTQAAALVDAVADFRDRDSLRRLHGAEDDDYAAAGLAHDAKDAPFAAVDELLQVKGMTMVLYRQVAPALTVHSRSGRVDEATASRLVLRALPGQTDADIEARLSRREQRQGAREGEEQAEPSAGDEAGLLERLRRTRGRTFTVRAEARTETGAVFVRKAVVGITARGDEPFVIHAWRQGHRARGPADDGD